MKITETQLVRFAPDLVMACRKNLWIGRRFVRSTIGPYLGPGAYPRVICYEEIFRINRISDDTVYCTLFTPTGTEEKRELSIHEVCTTIQWVGEYEVTHWAFQYWTPDADAIPRYAISVDRYGVGHAETSHPKYVVVTGPSREFVETDLEVGQGVIRVVESVNYGPGHIRRRIIKEEALVITKIEDYHGLVYFLDAPSVHKTKMLGDKELRTSYWVLGSKVAVYSSADSANHGSLGAGQKALRGAAYREVYRWTLAVDSSDRSLEMLGQCTADIVVLDVDFLRKIMGLHENSDIAVEAHKLVARGVSVILYSPDEEFCQTIREALSELGVSMNDVRFIHDADPSVLLSAVQELSADYIYLGTASWVNESVKEEDMGVIIKYEDSALTINGQLVIKLNHEVSDSELYSTVDRQPSILVTTATQLYIIKDSHTDLEHLREKLRLLGI